MQWSLKLGAAMPLEWTPAHDEILTLSDRLWDDLRWVWIRARTLEEAAEDAMGDADLLAARAAHREAEEVVDAAFEARRQARRSARSREVALEIETAINTALETRSKTRRALYTHARRVRSTIRPQILTILRARDRTCRMIAAGKGRRYPQLHWAQCNDILARYETAAREAQKRGRFPRPSREHPSRSLYVQLQAHRHGGTRVEVPGKQRARIVGGELIGTTWSALTAQGRTLAVRIERGHRPGRRIGSAQEVRRMLLTLPCGEIAPPLRVPVTVPRHREPKADALVKGVRLVRRGPHEWYAVLSIDGSPLHRSEPGGGTFYCGVNWRRTSRGLRVLDGVDETGVRVQVHVPPEMLASWTYADALASALDRAGNLAAELLAALRPDADVPDLLRRRDWKGLRNLALEHPALVRWVRGSVPVRDRHAALLAARRQVGSEPEKYAERAAEILGDIAGRDQVAGLRSKATRRREHLYRRCARWIAERYGRIVVAESDGAKLARVEDPETGEHTELPLPARRARQAAAPYTLLAAIRWATVKARGEVVESPAVDCSHRCPLCGEEMERSPADRAALMLRCSQHGIWDRDHALAMALWREAAPEDRERWEWHAASGRRSHAEIVSVDAEVRRDLRGHGTPHARLRYVAGLALADGVDS
jgi:hypothetical protein